MTIARVAVDVPIPGAFDYRCGTLDVRPGHLVVVPFGRRRQVGVVLELARHSEIDAGRLRDVQRVLPVEPLTSEFLQLIRFCSDYYRHPIGQVALATLPTALRRTAYRPEPAPRFYALTEAGGQVKDSDLPPRAAAMRRLLAALRAPSPLAEAQARKISGRAAAILAGWLAQGWIRPALATPGDAGKRPSITAGPALTDEQARAVAAVSGSAGTFAPWLLEGVTGSGKTEVYFRLIEQALVHERQVLLLVPEINLTPQLEARFRGRFPGTSLVSLHSGLAEGERCRRWLAAREGSAAVVIGTRLAVFTPMPALGLVIVDEEHDASFKQQDGVRYSARDLAVFLAQRRGVPVVLGSATPSLETYQNALAGRFGHLRLTLRPAASRPAIRLVEIRRHEVPGLSEEVLAAIGQRLARGEQTLAYLNRRGYAPALMCASCGWAAECSRCNARLVWHLHDKVLRCHHCGHEARLPQACPTCGNQDLRGLGQGTQRLEQALAARFSAARILRIDRDTTRRKHAWAEMREDIHADRADILVGTQMLAKGHDFPKLTLVVVVDPDLSLFSADFRAAERLYQQLMQVAGRAGRADLPGEVLVQTRFPGHPVFQALLRQDYASFAAELLQERRGAGFPPFVHQAVLRAEATREDAVQDFLRQAVHLAGVPPAGVTLYDPVPAAMARRAGHHRAHLLVQSPARPALQAFLAAWHPRLAEQAGRVRWALDVDPVDL
jgi:primosomal protein N' (replication factor Y)